MWLMTKYQGAPVSEFKRAPSPVVLSETQAVAFGVSVPPMQGTTDVARIYEQRPKHKPLKTLKL